MPWLWVHSSKSTQFVFRPVQLIWDGEMFNQVTRCWKWTKLRAVPLSPGSWDLYSQRYNRPAQCGLQDVLHSGKILHLTSNMFCFMKTKQHSPSNVHIENIKNCFSLTDVIFLDSHCRCQQHCSCRPRPTTSGSCAHTRPVTQARPQPPQTDCSPQPPSKRPVICRVSWSCTCRPCCCCSSCRLWFSWRIFDE